MQIVVLQLHQLLFYICQGHYEKLTSEDKKKEKTEYTKKYSWKRNFKLNIKRQNRCERVTHNTANFKTEPTYTGFIRR